MPSSLPPLAGLRKLPSASVSAPGNSSRSAISAITRPAHGIQVVYPAKLQPPHASHHIVAHERLVSLRPTPDEAKVVEVIAPAGYGKTTLLAEWVGHDPSPVLWVTLDEHDDDPTRLVTHIDQALLDSKVLAPELADAIESPSTSTARLSMHGASDTKSTYAPSTGRVERQFCPGRSTARS